MNHIRQSLALCSEEFSQCIGVCDSAICISECDVKRDQCEKDSSLAKKAIMVLSTYKASNEPVLIPSNGEISLNIVGFQSTHDYIKFLFRYLDLFQGQMIKNCPISTSTHSSETTFVHKTMF